MLETLTPLYFFMLLYSLYIRVYVSLYFFFDNVINHPPVTIFIGGSGQADLVIGSGEFTKKQSQVVDDVFRAEDGLQVQPSPGQPSGQRWQAGRIPFECEGFNMGKSTING